jgi:uncharacterized membrane protein
MRALVLVLAVAAWLSLSACARTNAITKTSSDPAANTSSAASKSAAKVDFDSQIKPVLQGKCQPCHFSGGKVYTKMPFDRPETIKTLGTKLFTRIKDENERRVIREFLAQP